MEDKLVSGSGMSRASADKVFPTTRGIFDKYAILSHIMD